VHRYDPETGVHRSYPVGQPVGAAAPGVGPGLVLAVRDGYAALDLESGEVTPIVDVARGDQAPRMNDGRSTRRGGSGQGRCPPTASPAPAPRTGSNRTPR
jgi:sugar lactone lactonase YvrE